MVLDRAGTPASEDDVCAGWQGSKKGFALSDGAALIGGTFLPLDPDDPRTYDYLRAVLRDGRWIIAQVFVAELGRALEDRLPPLASAHGPLPTTDFFRHVVVLVEATPEGFWFLDPWFRTEDQPLFLAGVSFARAFQGAIVVSRVLPSDD
jgi:hypothetical protein